MRDMARSSYSPLRGSKIELGHRQSVIDQSRFPGVVDEP